MQVNKLVRGQPAHFRMLGMTHFSQQDNFSVAARVLGALFYYAPESAEAAPLVAVLTSDGWETQWPSTRSVISAAGDGFSDTV